MDLKNPRDADRLWAAVDDQRRRTADLLDDLRDDEWLVQSLCSEWTVRDVAAHLTLQQMGFGNLLGVVIRTPGAFKGSLNQIIRDAARNKAALPTEQFAPQVRAMIGSRRHNFGVTPLETLTDILVHGQDIAIPLGRDLEFPPEPASWAAARQWAFGGKGMAKVFQSLPLFEMRLTATDIDWAVGDGPEIRGTMGDLLLLITGRTVALERVEGEGAQVLRTPRVAG